MTCLLLGPAQAVSLPPAAAVAGLYRRADLADAFSVSLPPGATGDPEVLARLVLGSQAAWVRWLLHLRDALVGRFGIKTSRDLAASTDGARRIGFFRIFAVTADEIVLGEDDSHLDFRVSLLVRPDGAGRRLTATTVVQCHNRLGRAYIAAIAPFHRGVVRSALNRAARRGWVEG